MAKKKTAKSKKVSSIKTKPSKAAPKVAKVGKGKPPEHTRFNKGVSGNPKGRPKGSKNFNTVMMDAAKRPVVANIDGKPRKISTLAAAAMQLGAKAAGGDSKAMGQFLDRIEEIEAKAAAARPAEFPFSQGDLEVLREVYERMKQVQSEGLRN